MNKIMSWMEDIRNTLSRRRFVTPAGQSFATESSFDKLPEEKKAAVFKEAVDKEYSETIRLLSKE